MSWSVSFRLYHGGRGWRKAYETIRCSLIFFIRFETYFGSGPCLPRMRHTPALCRLSMLQALRTKSIPQNVLLHVQRKNSRNVSCTVRTYAPRVRITVNVSLPAHPTQPSEHATTKWDARGSVSLKLLCATDNTRRFDTTLTYTAK